MEFLRRLTGTGTLRPSSGGAIQVEYWLTIGRRKTGPSKGEVVGIGQVKADMWIFLAASAGQASFTLQDGVKCQVLLHHLTPTTAEIRVLPPFGALVA